MKAYNKKDVEAEVAKKMKDQPATNSAQRAYLLARAHLQALRNMAGEMEKAYIAAKGIRNKDGTIPAWICSIDDRMTFDQANEETSAEIEGCGLWKDILEAEETLKTAEDDLIAYGLSLVPASTRAILERGVKESYTVRMKVIDVVVRLDVSTVPGKGVAV